MATPSRGVRGALTGETAAEWVKARADCMVYERERADAGEVDAGLGTYVRLVDAGPYSRGQPDWDARREAGGADDLS